MMSDFYYDLHVHSALSPCADNDNTPNNILGMALLCGIDIIALTDHNTCKNCPAFLEAAENYGLTAIAGMELTTSEDIHVVCLFENLSDAMAFDEFVNSKRVLIKNRPEFFGEQLVMDKRDSVVAKEEYLLTNATQISVDSVYSLVKEYNGVCYPAHIDREANGIIAILGTLPLDAKFNFFELNGRENLKSFSTRYGINESSFIISSDAHYLTDMRDKENFFTLNAEKENPKNVREELFKILRR